jgi:nucleotide-binding universal stress UspA family protein
MRPIKKILVPTDFSDCSREALDYAVGLARTVGASIEVLYVWQLPSYIGPEAALLGTGGNGLPIATYIRQEAAAEMERYLAGRNGEGEPTVRGKIEMGQPVERIVETAKQGSYDLIVLGTHGRSGMARLFVGSVTENVLRRAPCPVLAVRSKEEGR